MLEIIYDYPYSGINFIIRGLNHKDEAFIIRSIDDLYDVQDIGGVRVE